MTAPNPKNNADEGQVPVPAAPSATSVSPAKKERFSAEAVLFQSRWLLYPINCGLMLALLVYLGRFAYQVGELILHAPKLITNTAAEEHELMVAIVGLLDQAMICSLLIMTIMGGHQIYVRRFKEELTARGPYWLQRVDTIVLKVKLGLAFTGVSSVVLLKDCVSATVVPMDVWISHVVIHVVFLGTTIITAIVWRIMHPGANNSSS